MLSYNEGKKVDGKFYLKVGREWIEVEERIYRGYMRLVWQQNKQITRQLKCNVGGKRCNGKCSECENEKDKALVSLDQLREEMNFDVKDSHPSIEDRIFDKFLKKTLRDELKELSPDDRTIIGCIYYEDVPYTQRQIAKVLHVSQQAINKRHQHLLKILRERIEAKICG